MANQSHEWNIPIPPDLMYHTIDTYLSPSTTLALCAAFPCLWLYCHPQPYRHISVCVSPDWSFSEKISVQIKLSSIQLAVKAKWCNLDKYLQEFITALLQRSSLCSVSLKDFDIPANILCMGQNLKILEIDRSLGPPENVSFQTGRAWKVCLEKITLHSLDPMLVGAGSPFDWSRLNAIEYHKHRDISLSVQELLVSSSASLHLLDIAVHMGNEEVTGPLDLGVLTGLRHIRLSISLTYCFDATRYNICGTISSLTPFEWVPFILASCNGHNTIETIVIRFGTANPEDPRRCNWLSVDKIFEREGTWTSLKEVLVVIMKYNYAELHTSHALEPNHLELVEPSTTPSLQAREIISWYEYNR